MKKIVRQLTLLQGVGGVGITTMGKSFMPSSTDWGKLLTVSSADAVFGDMIVLPGNKAVGTRLPVKRANANEVEFVAGYGATVTHSRITGTDLTAIATVTSNADGKSAVWTITGDAEAVTDTDADAHFARVTAANSAWPLARRVHATRMIRALKRRSLWTKYDGIVIIARTEAETLINWKQNAFHPVKHGTWTFTADVSYNGAGGVGDYLDTLFNPSTAGGAMTQNSAHIAEYALSGANGGGSALDIGNGRTSILNRSGTNNVFRVNATSSTTTALTGFIEAFQTGSGYHCAFRNDASNQSLLKDNNTLVTGAVASTSQLSAVLTIGGTAAAGLARTYQFHTWGSGFTEAEAREQRDIIFTYLKAAGIYTEERFTAAPLSSTDAVTYGEFSSQSQSAIAVCGAYVYRANEGIKGAPAGTDGENGGVYVRLSRIDKTAMGGAWEHVKFFLPTDTDYLTSAESLTDMKLLRLPDERLLVLLPYNQSATDQTVWAIILENPEEPVKASLVWSTPRPLDYYFSGRPYLHNGEVRGSFYSAAPGVPAPRASRYGQNHYRLSIVGDAIWSERISAVPSASYATESYFQTTQVQFSTDSVFSIQRTTAGLYTCYSQDGGLTWSSPIALASAATGVLGFGAVARAEIITLANGRKALGFNNTSTTKRENLSVAIGDMSGTSLVLEKAIILDSRGNTDPRPSEPSIADDIADGDALYMQWDCGRGKTPAGGPYINDEVSMKSSQSRLLGAGTFDTYAVVV